MAAIRDDDLVVTPSKRLATVLGIDAEGFATIAYSPLRRELGVVHVTLLKRVSSARLKRLERARR